VQKTLTGGQTRLDDCFAFDRYMDKSFSSGQDFQEPTRHRPRIEESFARK
jgi:hypothetical protein